MPAPLARPLPERARDYVARALTFGVLVSFLSYYGLLCFRHSWGADFQMYVAAASRLYSNFWQPTHEALDVSYQQSSMYTPYLFVVAGIGKLLGATPYRALEWAGLFNLMVYVMAIEYFFSRHSLHYRYRLAAACFLLVTLWVRWAHFGWSSETSLATFQFIQAYPSTLAWSLAFVALGLIEDLRRRTSPIRCVALTLDLALLLTCHLLTASWVIGTLVVYAVYTCIADGRGRLLLVVLAAAFAALALALLWPYGAVFGHLSTANVPEPSPFGERPLYDFAALYLVGLPVSLWFGYRLRRHVVWVCCFVATYLALAAWRLLDVSFGNRYALFMAFFAQFLVAEATALAILMLSHARASLKLPFVPRLGDRVLLGAALLASVLLPLASPMWLAANDPNSSAALLTPSALLQQPPPDLVYYVRYRALAPYLSSRDVVMAPTSRVVFDLASVTGAHFVSAPGAIHAPDVLERFQAAALFFQLGTGAGMRGLLIARYRATRVLVPANLAALLPELRRQLGAPIYQDARFSLFDASSFGGVPA